MGVTHMNNEKTPTKQWLERGQSFTEMALGFVFFLFFVMGMLDLGRLYFQYVALEDAAGEAALFLALNAQCPAPPGHEDCADIKYEEEQPDGTTVEKYGCPSPKCNDPNNARARASNASNLLDFSNNDKATIDWVQLWPTANREAMVEVTLRYPFHLLTPVIADIVGDDTVVLEASASQVLLGQ
jgi:Flp pilus assembly protein TadG